MGNNSSSRSTKNPKSQKEKCQIIARSIFIGLGSNCRDSLPFTKGGKLE